MHFIDALGQKQGNVILRLSLEPFDRHRGFAAKIMTQAKGGWVFLGTLEKFHLDSRATREHARSHTCM